MEGGLAGDASFVLKTNGALTGQGFDSARLPPTNMKQSTYIKALEVINSCKTFEHYLVAFKYIKLALLNGYITYLQYSDLWRLCLTKSYPLRGK